MFDYKRFHLPASPGIYIFKDRGGRILYVGKALNLKNRVSSYFTKGMDIGSRTKIMLSQAVEVETIVVGNEIEALLLEANFIKRYLPRYNVAWTDGKAYPFIRITIKDKYPKVLEARSAQDKKSLYFGPYATTGDMRQVLRLVRGIFPFKSVLNHPKKPCLYFHLGLCPCPEVFDGEEMQKMYGKNILYLVRFLQGKKTGVLRNLLKDMKQAAKKEEFEEAGKIKERIQRIELITKPFRKPIEYLENPNLTRDMREKELSELKKVLTEQGLKLYNLERIECYDISNIQGKEATGSLIVLTNGEIDKSQYRHFKIRLANRPNDVAMMKEVLHRRMNHKEWPVPSLIIVDGGKGQVGGAISVLKEKRVEIPVIGLAKRLEEIVIMLPPGRHLARQNLSLELYKIIRLSFDSPALNLLRRIRDEAHRFAVQYHRKLRLKTISL